MTSSQLIEGEKETIIVDTEAEITGNADNYKIAYIETQGDTAGEETVIHVTGGKRLTISRKSSKAMSSLIILERGVRHITRYSSSGMSFNLGMSCSEMTSDFEGGKLYFRYESDMELVPIGEIEFEFLFQKN